jgi:carbon-monoxide dehydrogenase iron sulfur subunit
MNRKVLFHPERCLVCLSCVLACQMNSAGTSEIRKIPQGRASSEKISVTFARGTPWVWTCQHCVPAPCVEACISGSLRYEDGRGVIHHPETCVGCGSCVLVCPHGALRYDEKEERVTKCNLCVEHEVPPCVQACQTRALVYQDVDLFVREKKKQFVLDLKVSRETD